MKPKISLFGPSPRFLSGISYYTIRLANSLSLHTNLTAILFREMLPRLIFPGGKRVGNELTSLQYSNQVSVREVIDWYNPASWFRAARIAKKSDLILLQWWTSSVAHMYLLIILINRRRCKIVTEFHEVLDPLEHSILPLRFYSRMVAWVIRKNVTHFVVHSEHDKKLVSHEYRIKESRITVIPHGLYDHYCPVECESVRDQLQIYEQFIILFFGLIRPYKGLKYLIQAFESMGHEELLNARLLVVGELWEDTESVSAITGSRVQEKITFVNRYVDDAEICSYFSLASVVALPYTRASQSGVAHIAISFGLPVVASDVGGLKEALQGYKGATFVPPCDSDALKLALLSWKGSHERFTPPEHLSWEIIAESWINLWNTFSEVSP